MSLVNASDWASWTGFGRIENECVRGAPRVPSPLCLLCHVDAVHLALPDVFDPQHDVVHDPHDDALGYARAPRVGVHVPLANTARMGCKNHCDRARKIEDGDAVYAHNDHVSMSGPMKACGNDVDGGWVASLNAFSERGRYLSADTERASSPVE